MEQPAETTQSTNNKEVSDNPLDYLSMIVYIKDGVQICEQIKNLVAPRLDILVQNVDMIKEQRPTWLTGVPTVVMLPSRQILTGTKAVQVVSEACQETMQGADGLQAVRGGTVHASLSSAAAHTPPSFNTLFSCQDDNSEHRTSGLIDSPLLTPDARYEDKPREKHNDRSLEEIMRMRGGV